MDEDRRGIRSVDDYELIAIMKQVPSRGPFIQLNDRVLKLGKDGGENRAIVCIESCVRRVRGVQSVEESVKKQREERWAVNAALKCAAVHRNLEREHLGDGVSDCRCMIRDDGGE